MDQVDHSDDMREEYDFSPGVQGKHFRDYRAGHLVQVRKPDGTVEEHHFTLEEGAVMIDPDLKSRFPDSDSVNNALRSLAANE
jgi:hypothetical protein